MTSSRNILVFTDLDGTLLDENYSWSAASEALEKLKSEGIPLILCSSKTRPEIEIYQKRMGLKDPFISENGGGIFIPEAYFSFDFPHTRDSYGNKIIDLAEPYAKVRAKLDELRPLGQITGFGDMTVEEISRDTDLTLEEAALAKSREYGEPFKFLGDLLMLEKAAEREGFNLTRGTAYWHLSKGCDKGKAVEALTSLYKKDKPDIQTVALGNSRNDISMLKKVDIPIWIMQMHDNSDYNDIPNLRKSASSGPEGWNEEILKLLSP